MHMYSQRCQQPLENFNYFISQKQLPKSLHRRYNQQTSVIQKHLWWIQLRYGRWYLVVYWPELEKVALDLWAGEAKGSDDIE